MHAIVQRSYGSADVLKYAEVDAPTPGPRDVLIDVRAAGMDRGTWHLMKGTPHLVRIVGPRRPKNPVPGLDVAGVVRAIGNEVTRFSIGDEVVGTARGSFAEQALAREDKLALKPASLSWEQAAVLSVSGTTALQAVVGSAKVHAGDRVLVIGASGGVGSYTVQIAAALGADVTAVCSAEKAAQVKELGARTVLDYRVDDYLATSRRYDVIIDIAGGSPIRRLRSALTRKGTLVLVGNETGDALTGGMPRQIGAALLSPFIGQRLVMLVSIVKSDHLQELAQLVDAGTLTPRVDRTFPLSKAAEAMRLLESGQVTGKLALTVEA